MNEVLRTPEERVSNLPDFAFAPRFAIGAVVAEDARRTLSAA